MRRLDRIAGPGVGVRLALAAAGVALSSCAMLPPQSGSAGGVYFDRQGIDVVLAPADVQSNYFKDVGSRERYCRSPQADVATTVSEGMAIGLGLPVGTQKSIGEDAARGALALGGRNPGVLIARELMYRACELSLNLNADTALTMRIYERFLQSVETIAKLQTGAGVAALAGTAGDTGVKLPTVTAPTSDPTTATIPTN